jgi:hypothetical protein
MNTPQKRRNPMMTNWYEKSINMLQLNSKGERTQEAYTRAVRMLTEFYGKTPDRITEPATISCFPLPSPNHSDPSSPAISASLMPSCLSPRQRRLKPWPSTPNTLAVIPPGFFGVLHTWGRQLQYHPHIHYLVSGGAFDSHDGQ